MTWPIYLFTDERTIIDNIITYIRRKKIYFIVFIVEMDESFVFCSSIVRLHSPRHTYGEVLDFKFRTNEN